jgi:hypothetical protein
MSQIGEAEEMFGGAIGLAGFLRSMPEHCPRVEPKFRNFLRAACDVLDPEDTDLIGSMVRIALDWDDDRPLGEA